MRLLVALVVDRDADAAVQERELAQPLREDVEAELGGLEDQRVGLEGDLRAALLGLADLGERRLGLAALVALRVDLAVAPDLDLEHLGERVHDRDADAVQAARDLVGALVELAAGVELGQHDLGGGDALGRVHLDRDAAAVVLDRDAAVDVDRDRDARAVPGQRLVDRVVDDLEDEVVQAPLGGVADVHPGALADGLEAFEDLDRVRPVALCRGSGWLIRV